MGGSTSSCKQCSTTKSNVMHVVWLSWHEKKLKTNSTEKTKKSRPHNQTKKKETVTPYPESKNPQQKLKNPKLKISKTSPEKNPNILHVLRCFFPSQFIISFTFFTVNSKNIFCQTLLNEKRFRPHVPSLSDNVNLPSPSPSRRSRPLSNAKQSLTWAADA